jgi:ring-1,2-phenylacetyl-CoA epoxidase subunit PaaE
LTADNADRLVIEWLFSSHQDLWKARLNKLILEKLLHQYMSKPEKTLVYICGPFDYMRMAAIVLQAAGIPPENIKREVFTPGISISPERPPDVLPHQVEVRIQGRVYKFTVQFPDSILQAARKLGIELPYSCEAGRCGSCVASCTTGKIWMKYNEVLTDREVNNGRVLVCNGFPVGGDAVVSFDPRG